MSALQSFARTVTEARNVFGGGGVRAWPELPGKDTHPLDPVYGAAAFPTNTHNKALNAKNRSIIAEANRAAARTEEEIPVATALVPKVGEHGNCRKCGKAYSSCKCKVYETQLAYRPSDNATGYGWTNLTLGAPIVRRYKGCAEPVITILDQTRDQSRLQTNSPALAQKLQRRSDTSLAGYSENGDCLRIFTIRRKPALVRRLVERYLEAEKTELKGRVLGAKGTLMSVFRSKTPRQRVGSYNPLS